MLTFTSYGKADKHTVLSNLSTFSLEFLVLEKLKETPNTVLACGETRQTCHAQPSLLKLYLDNRCSGAEVWQMVSCLKVKHGLQQISRASFSQSMFIYIDSVTSLYRL